MTTGGRRRVSVIVQRDGDLNARTWRFPLWVLRGLGVAGVAVVVATVLGVAFYAPIARQAARVPRLTREVERLEIDNRRIRELAAALDSVEAGYERLRQMVGADVVPDPMALSSAIPVAPPVYASFPGAPPRYEEGPSRPGYWPLDERGFMTRGQAAPGSGEEEHPGIDIAVPIGSVVRAAGGGIVLQTGSEAEYGNFVLLEHPEGYQSMYGHLSRVLAVQGMRVQAGDVIARSGNSGRSTAPHLHFEIRLNGVSVDPGTLVKEDR
ncbi:MAG TPA: M23 family metallopeptidase [Gemmatimonadales bacterium]|nr:M23 family metallopeptidase [Gemmatimonadales bacterium]